MPPSVQDVGGRNKSGHDDLWGGRTKSGYGYLGKTDILNVHHIIMWTLNCQAAAFTRLATVLTSSWLLNGLRIVGRPWCSPGSESTA